MIKIDKKTRLVRECTAPFEYSKDGAIVTDTIRVRYFSPTIAEAKLRRAALQQRAKDNPEDIVWLSEELISRYGLAELPDIAGPDNKPIEITAENLDHIDTFNLEAIKKAIEDDRTPKEQPSK